jgi:hypothetical protein
MKRFSEVPLEVTFYLPAADEGGAHGKEALRTPVSYVMLLDDVLAEDRVVWRLADVRANASGAPSMHTILVICDRALECARRPRAPCLRIHPSDATGARKSPSGIALFRRSACSYIALFRRSACSYIACVISLPAVAGKGRRLNKKMREQRWTTEQKDVISMHVHVDI